MRAEDRRRHASIAARARHHPDDPTLDEDRRNLRAQSLAEYIEREVAKAPPLSAEQRHRLAALLHPVSEDSAA